MITSMYSTVFFFTGILSFALKWITVKLSMPLTYAECAY